MARKDYVISSRFPAASKEHYVLEMVLASDRSCENIVDNFGSLAIGADKYSLFMPLAICDLSAYMMDYHPIKLSTTQEKAAIILSAWGLARGLEFLHQVMKIPKGENQVCYHMDLKPSNILTFQGDDDRKILKISDFGMAPVILRKTGDRSEKEGDFNSWFVKRSKRGPAPTCFRAEFILHYAVFLCTYCFMCVGWHSDHSCFHRRKRLHSHYVTNYAASGS